MDSAPREDSIRAVFATGSESIRERGWTLSRGTAVIYHGGGGVSGVASVTGPVIGGCLSEAIFAGRVSMGC